MKTMIDILKKGNQELFHSSIVAWLLDPGAEHELKDAFAQKIVELIYIKGCEFGNLQELKNYVVISQGIKVQTEAKALKGRYDIELTLNGHKYVLENKTKSIGGVTQFDMYADNGVNVIGLGFTKLNFSKEVRDKYPIIEYRDVFNILKSLDINAKNEYQILVKHYTIHLERELALLGAVTQFSELIDNQKISIYELIMKFELKTKDYSRFLNWYYLQLFLNNIIKDKPFKGGTWGTSKNQISGAWLSSYKSPSSLLKLSSVINDCCRKYKAEVWLHIQFNNGVCAVGSSDLAGEIQLKAKCKDKDNKAFFEEIKAHIPDDLYFRRRPSNSYKTFTFASKPLIRDELCIDTLKKEVLLFIDMFSVKAVH